MKKIKYKETLSAEALQSAEKVPAYRHPQSARTAARHLDGEAYTATGLHCGPVDQAAKSAPAKPPVPPKK